MLFCIHMRIWLKKGDIIEIIVKYGGEYAQLLVQLAQAGEFMAEDLGVGYAVIYADKEDVGALYGIPSVIDIELPRNVYVNELPSENDCPPSPEFRFSGYSGRGVLVGIVDTGIDYTNPEFLDSGGRTRILSLWDQTYDGDPPQGFISGTEYTDKMINYALMSPEPFSVIPPTDISGHGTAVAGIAAGTTMGRAFGADIIAVKTIRGSGEASTTVQLMRGLYYIIRKAQELGKPLAVNISYGMNEGSHRGDSLFERYITDVSRLGRTSVMIPTGNEGGAGHHYSGRLSDGETLDIDFFTAGNISSLYLSLWKDYTDEFSAELILPNGKSTGIVNSFTNRAESVIDGLSIKAFYGQPTRRSIFQEIFYDISPLYSQIPSGLWTLVLRAQNIVNGHFDIWLPTVEQAGTGTFFTEPSDELTMTIPSTADNVIRTAGYDRRTGSAAAFSGRGGGYPYCIRPDIAAPGVNVSAPSLYGGISSVTGTSFASPLVTGIAAQLMEWGIVCGNSPFLYGEKLKAEIHLLARRSDGVIYPDTVIGYGVI